ncbi:MAG: CPBP family intramembrane glutamic endopeptidase [Acidobacteriaceae bacterium]
MASPVVTPMPPKKQAVSVTLFGLFLALVCPEIFVLANGHAHLLGGELLFWALTIALLVYVVAVEKRPLASIGLRRPTWRTAVWGVCAGLVMLVGIGLIYGVAFRVLHLTMNMQAMARLLALPFGARLLLVVRAALFEEIAWRGYAIERLTELTGSRMAAATIAWAAFTVAHLSYWGAAQLIVAGFGGLVLTVLYVWRRDLPSNMLAHFLTDGAGLLLH